MIGSFSRSCTSDYTWSSSRFVFRDRSDSGWLDYEGYGESSLSDPFEVYRVACTHPSFSREFGGKNNEVLEFIGDSVLQLLVTELLVLHFPNDSEGKLSQMRHKLVNNPVLAECSRALRLGMFLRLGRGEERNGGREREKILANLFEACLGAVYTQHGLFLAREVVVAHFVPRFRTVQSKKPKQILHEWSQKQYRRVPEYLEIARSGPPHNLWFTVAVLVNEEEVGRGEGKNFKKATQNAAKEAVLVLNILS
ncbi:MAG: ribonuclease III [Deltaproteobacteria bacterium]|nr:ribonuclease III [Deltaproteobacteria bacterium]